MLLHPLLFFVPGGVLLYLKGITKSPKSGKTEIERVLQNGEAYLKASKRADLIPELQAYRQRLGALKVRVISKTEKKV